jgi:hypothetical protein
MTNQPNGPDPLLPWWKGRWGIGVFVLVAALLAGGILWLVQPDSTDDHCAPGVPDLHWPVPERSGNASASPTTWRSRSIPS